MSSAPLTAVEVARLDFLERLMARAGPMDNYEPTAAEAREYKALKLRAAAPADGAGGGDPDAAWLEKMAGVAEADLTWGNLGTPVATERLRRIAKRLRASPAAGGAEPTDDIYDALADYVRSYGEIPDREELRTMLRAAGAGGAAAPDDDVAMFLTRLLPHISDSFWRCEAQKLAEDLRATPPGAARPTEGEDR